MKVMYSLPRKMCTYTHKPLQKISRGPWTPWILVNNLYTRKRGIYRETVNRMRGGRGDKGWEVEKEVSHSSLLSLFNFHSSSVHYMSFLGSHTNQGLERLPNFPTSSYYWKLAESKCKPGLLTF